MALNTALEELLKTLPADVQANQRAILEKHPSLGEGWLRQADYDRYMNTNKEKVAKVEEVENWYNLNKPKFEQMKTTVQQLEDDKRKLQAEIETKSVAAAAAVAAGDGTAIDPAKIAAAVTQQLAGRIPTSEDLTRMIGEQTVKASKDLFEAARKNFYENDFKGAVTWMTGMNDVLFRHRDEFSKPLDRVAFSKFMEEQKIVDPGEAYEKFTEPARRAKEVEAEVQRRFDERLKESAESQGIPGTTGPSAGGGHFQTRLEKKDEKDPLFGGNFELGDNTAAVAAAKEWRTELATQKF
jgi:hypothetical protein